MSPTKRGGKKRDKKLPRWTPEEIEFLQARFDRPFKAVVREYQRAGYRRTERAVSVKYYGLKKEAGLTARRGRNPGGSVAGRPVGHQGAKALPAEHAALELAAKHDLATLQAAQQVRQVLDGLS